MRADDRFRAGTASIAVIAAVGAIAGAMLSPVGADAAETASASFTTTGEHAFVVPAGVTSVQVTLVGGTGGEGSESHNTHKAPGGAGRIAVATLAVSPGETLFAEVAGNGLSAGMGGYGGGGTGGLRAFNGEGGGGGGGASDVRRCAMAQSPASCAPGSSLASRLVVAAGGGGGGGAGGETPSPNNSIEGGSGGEGDTTGAGGAQDAKKDHGGGGGKQGGPSSPGAPGAESELEATAGGLGTGGNGGQSFSGGGGGGGGGVFGGGGGGGGGSTSEPGFILYNSAGGGGGGGGSGVPAGTTGVSGFSFAEPLPGAQPSAAFTWTLPPPAAVTGSPQAVTSTSATLTGTVNPDGSSVNACNFLVSPAPPSGASIPCSQQVGAGASPLAVSAALGGLSPATVYTVTLVASSAQGTSTGAPVTFTTPLAPATPASSGSGPQRRRCDLDGQQPQAEPLALPARQARRDACQGQNEGPPNRHDDLIHALGCGDRDAHLRTTADGVSRRPQMRCA